MKNLKKVAKYSLALVAGCLAFSLAAPLAYAQAATTTVCFRGRNVEINPALIARYTAAGATPGPCVVSPG